MRKPGAAKPKKTQHKVTKRARSTQRKKDRFKVSLCPLRFLGAFVFEDFSCNIIITNINQI